MSILQRPLVLASTSLYRRDILAKLRLPFTQVSPDYDEIALPGELPNAMARRFAAGKALAAAFIEEPGNGFMQGSIVIGSDQVVSVNGERLSKPGTVGRAEAQLSQCSGQWVTYCSALSLASQNQTLTLEHDLYHVKFRKLTAAEIQRYVALDQPLDCAGSIKAESLGISLISSTRGDDINTLYGLPLLRLAQRLREHGIDPLRTL
ncbi:MAG: MAF protein [Candidatus Pseudothioglobus sp.]|jgi:septum formation protein